MTSEEGSCLEKERWLLDQQMLFFLTYLCSIKWNQSQEDIEIIEPSVAQMLKMCNNEDEDVEQFQTLNIVDGNLVLIPVNNAQCKEEKGCHGSILIFFP